MSLAKLSLKKETISNLGSVTGGDYTIPTIDYTISNKGICATQLGCQSKVCGPVTNEVSACGTACASACGSPASDCWCGGSMQACPTER